MDIGRRLLLWVGVIAMGMSAGIVLAEDAEAEPLFRFGAVADCQYCNATSSRRKYDQSPKKLAACVEHYNRLDLSFVVHLGDFIDRDFASFDVVAPIYQRLRAPHFHVLGNHDFSVADDKKLAVPARLGLKERYYDFTREGWRFVVIDGNDVSTYAWPKDDPRTAAAKALRASIKPQPAAWNGALSKEQLAWLESRLKLAQEAGERVMLFCHFPVFPKNGHNLWNDVAVCELLARYPCVAAYVNGHNHNGNYGQRDGIHYLTLKGMVDTDETSYAVIAVYADKLVVQGFGRQGNQTLELGERK